MLIVAPLLLAIAELFHLHDLLNLDVSRWLSVLYAQTVLFLLSAWAIAAPVRERVDLAANICRVALFAFAVSYAAFDTAAGVVTGTLVKAATGWECPMHGAH